MSRIQRLANKTIPKAHGEFDLMYQTFDTEDIIKVIMMVHQNHKNDLDKFATHLKGYSIEKTLRNVWEFVQQNIQYRADKAGNEDVQSPPMLWKTKVGDCKSMSLMIGALLTSLDIPFVYRFAGYQGDKNVRHIYVVAQPPLRQYILDATISTFDYEVTPAFIDDRHPETNASIKGVFRMNGTSFSVAKTAFWGFIAVCGLRWFNQSNEKENG